MSYSWPTDFARIPDDPWIRNPVDELARKYDNVEAHGWYDNLDPTLEQLETILDDDSLLIDYSGGTGILAARLYQNAPKLGAATLIVDASPKFLRLALDKLGHDPRVGFRWIKFLPEKRLERLDEVLSPELRMGRARAIASTNAIHLYYDLTETLESWTKVLQDDGVALIQSGNIDNPNAPEGSWIIDQTVELLQPFARELAATDPAFADYRDVVDEAEFMASHDALRKKYFLPVRPLDFYLEALRDAGFSKLESTAKPIPARVDEWCEFLSAYHEGVLGWIGGAAKLTGKPCTSKAIEDRLRLLRMSLERVFDGNNEFDAAWTYITARR